MYNVAIIGAGALGTALAQSISDNWGGGSKGLCKK